jgi:pilus assembly protein CpaB
MKSRAVIPLVIGLAIGILAIRSFFNVLQKAKGSAKVDTVQVVRAKVNISPTIEIKEEMIELTEVPASFVPEGAFHDSKKVVDRVTSQMIPKGALVAPAYLAPPGTPPGMLSRIKDGYRAVAIKIDEIVGVAGWIKPGAHVDVVMVLNPRSGQRASAMSTVVLQNVEVLAVGQKVETGDSKAALSRSVTVLVKPEDATKLHLATTKGKLRLTMRSQDDNEETEPVILTDRDLLPTGLSAWESDTESDADRLRRLFGGQAQATTRPADNQQSGLMLASAAPVAQPTEPAWEVEVLSGRKAYKLAFDSDQADARIVPHTPPHSRTWTPPQPAAPSPQTSVKTSAQPADFSLEPNSGWDVAGVEYETDEDDFGGSVIADETD